MDTSNRFSEKTIESSYFAIRKFLNSHRGKDRLLIDDQKFKELRELFLRETNIHLNPSPANPLSMMEMVIVALATSLDIGQIAKVTMNSTNTVKTSLSRAGIKLNAPTKNRVVIEAIRKGYIEIQDCAA